MENQGFKSSAFGGFNKKEVLSYIFELNENAQDAHQKLTEQIEEITSSRDELTLSLEEAQARLEEMKSELDGLSARFDEETKKNAELTKQIDSLGFENKKQKLMIEDRDDEIRRISDVNADLEGKNRELEEKREQVGLAASQISALLTQARKDADRMMQQARDDAEKLILTAKSEAAQITRNAQSESVEMLKNANDSIDVIYRQFDAFCKELGAVQQHMIDAVSTMDAKLKTVNRSAAKARDTATENIKSFKASNAAKEQPVETEHSPETAMKLADDILSQYGIRRDESGFFRMSPEE